MLRKLSILAALLAALSSSFAFAQTLPVYSNGQENTANGTQTNVLITNSPQPLNVPTIVHFVSPALVGNLDVQGASLADFQSGQVTSINLTTWSNLNVKSGTVGQVLMRNGTRATIDGGTTTSLQAFDLSSATINSGSLTSVAALGKFGDSGTPATGGHSWVFINGGTIGTAQAGGGGTLSVVGGTIQSIAATSLGTTDLFGGHISALSLAAGTTTNVYGFNLNIADGVLRGVLSDGSPIQAPIANLQSNPTINLFNISGPVAIPEPSGVVLLGLAMTGFGIVVAHRKKR